MGIGNIKMFLVYFGCIFSIMSFSGCQDQATIHVYGHKENDIVKIVSHIPSIHLTFHGSPEEAVDQADEGGSFMVLADGYPNVQVTLTESFYDKIQQKNLRGFIEYPSIVPGFDMGRPVEAHAQRAVIRNDALFSGSPDSLQIMGINGLHFLPNEMDNSYIVAAKVAGFDSAIYGLPHKADPLLASWKDQSVLIATTNLSQFVSGRYAPEQEWGAIWKNILEYLLPDTEIETLKWEPTVAASFGEYELLPDDHQRISVKRGVEWYKKAKMLVPHSLEDTVQHMLENGHQRLAYDEDIPPADGTNGVFECIFSSIDADGSQPIGIVKRGDCISETAMAFATAGELLNESEYKTIARNLLDFYLIESIATKKEYGNPEHPAYGLIPWGISNRAWFKASYGDDNARFLLGALVTSAFTESDHWDNTLMKSLVALMRTTGKNGFRGSRIDLAHFEENGWNYYRDREIVNLAPHFEAYLWACYLWAYDQTGDPLFLDTAEKGIQTMMMHYPDGWTWTNGLAQERARMILPLAWLVRVSDTPHNRKMLKMVTSDFLKLQDESGAIREELGRIDMGKYPPPQSNEAYGTSEASLIAQNGDPVSDLLYTTNFAFLGLHEASHVTGDPEIEAATDRLAEFLCRIQVDSPAHPELDGGWMRAFDFDRWEHWGSNADHGWGAWAIESGWTQGWITTILGLRELDVSVWDLAQKSKAEEHYPALKKQMLSD